MEYRLTGLIAATYTPLRDDGSLNLDQVPKIVEYLEQRGIGGLYVCGSTGEGMSLTGAERRAVAEAYVAAAGGRLKTIIQVGHNSLAEARELAPHAGQIGADVISATAPSYFKVGTVDTLVDCMFEISSGAPQTPFYYYHIPSLTGAALDMVEFLTAASGRLPNLAGLKYTAPMVHEYQACLELDGGKFDVLWGCDEMFLSALVVGARGGIGSTYNIAAPLYGKLISAFRQGDLLEAGRLQSRSVQLIRTIYQYPFHPAMKEILKMLGLDCGPCRLPHPALTATQIQRLREDLAAINFFDVT
jgi:N-acetylneuraminate lyase